MTVQTAYRSTSGAVLDAWGAWQEARTTFRLRLEAAATDLAPDDHERRVVAFTRHRGYAAAGLAATDTDHGAPPTGWRPHHHETTDGGMMVLHPDRRTRIGKAADAVLCDLVLDDLNPPGMPRTVARGDGADMRWYSPALFRHEEAVYVGWGTDPEAKDVMDWDEGHGIDLALWERIPLSAYHLAAEALEIPA